MNEERLLFWLSLTLVSCHLGDKGLEPSNATFNSTQIDTVSFRERLDYEVCWLSHGELPVLAGIPDAESWNDSIAAYETYLKRNLLESREESSHGRTFCCGPECDGDDYIQFPRDEGLVGAFGFTVLSNDETALSLLLTCNVHYNGGSLNWTELHAVNIDPQSGRSIAIDPTLSTVHTDTIDARFRECIVFEACGKEERQYRHSQLFPNCVEDAVQSHRVGIEDNHWVVCQDFNPKSCGEMARHICIAPIKEFRPRPMD